MAFFLTGIQNTRNIQPQQVGSNSYRKLPAGGYVCRIHQVTVDSFKSGRQYINLAFDIAEGEYCGFFQQKFQEDASSQYGQRWRGNFKLFLPTINGDPAQFERDVARYKGNIELLTKTNGKAVPDIEQGYDPEIFNGCTVGILFRNVTKPINGTVTTFVEPAFLIDPQRIRTGDYEVPEDKVEQPKQQYNGGFYQPQQTTPQTFQQPAQQPSQASSPIYAAAQQQGYSQPLQQPTTPQQKQQRFQQVCEQMLQEAFPEPLQQPQRTFQQMAAQQPMQQPVPSAFTMPQNAAQQPVQPVQQPIPGGNLSDFAEQVITGDVPF